ncbi:MAG: hypothetical protein HQM16_18755 [Deltaproteobacteria bacterium]|nr:hypothetical protein [Deltaproteobacteria bacterium]
MVSCNPPLCSWRTIIRVPLIISLPGVVPQKRVVTKIARGLDIMPTIFDVLGLSVPTHLEGRSLLPLIDDAETGPERSAFASSSYQGYQADHPENIVDYMRAVRSKDWKLFYRIWNLKTEEFFLYALSTDPQEQRDVKHLYPAKFLEMKALLFEWINHSKTVVVPDEPDNRSLITRLSDGYDVFFADEAIEALIKKAPSPPKITYPQNGAVIGFDDTQGNLKISWTGIKGVPYLVDIVGGTGSNKLDTQFKSNTPWIEKKITKDYWNEYVILYQPVKVRVKINRPDHHWGEWVTFKTR